MTNLTPDLTRTASGRPFARRLLAAATTAALALGGLALAAAPASAEERPSVTANITTANTTDGLQVNVVGTGFDPSKLTSGMGNGVYVGIAPSGGLPDVSSSAGASAFFGATWQNDDALKAGENRFNATLTVKATELSGLDPTQSYSVYTWKAHNHATEEWDTETPLNITHTQWEDMGLLQPSLNVSVKANRSDKSYVYGKDLVSATATVTGVTSGQVQFYVNGKASKKVTVNSKGTATYSFTSKNKKVGSYKISAKYLGAGVQAASSTPSVTVKVIKAGTRKVSVSGKKFKKNSKPKVTVTVKKLNNGQWPTGKVKVYVNGKVKKTVTLKASHKGKITVTLPKQKKTVKVKAAYQGNSTTSGKTSGTVTIKRK